MNHCPPSGPMGLLFLLAGSLQVASGAPQELFSSLSGFWIGPGRIEFAEMASEALLCKAYYTTTGQADRLNIVLRCASRTNKIELRAKLSAEGSNLIGTWEERTFNASGTVAGKATDGKIALAIDSGGGFSATMLVIQDNAHHSVSITARGVGFKTVYVSLSRDASAAGGKRDAVGE